jgi:hypothetical protein
MRGVRGERPSLIRKIRREARRVVSARAVSPSNVAPSRMRVRTSMRSMGIGAKFAPSHRCKICTYGFDFKQAEQGRNAGDGAHRAKFALWFSSLGFGFL